MNSPTPKRNDGIVVLRTLFLAAGISVVFCHCNTNQTYKDIEYSPEKLATPYGHGLTKSEYPFDDRGNYRKDWVKTKTSERTRTSYPAPAVPESGASTETGTSMASTSGLPVSREENSATVPGYAGPADGAVAAPGGIPSYDAPASYSVSGGFESGSSSIPSSTSSSVYHKVVSGDTLYGIGRKYNVSVDELRRINGISGSNIMKGQTLRIR